MYRYKSNSLPPPPPPNLPPPVPTPLNNHNKPATKNKKKLCFNSLKKDTCNSLNDVEHFLCNFNSFVKYIKLYNLFKK